MTVEQCLDLTQSALANLFCDFKKGRFEVVNEATLQHHFALHIHLLSLDSRHPDIQLSLEKTLVRQGGQTFPPRDRRTANVDIIFSQLSDDIRQAIELKCFHRANQREPNNRYDAYADIARLETYLIGHSDVGLFVLFTDHPHYFDNNFQAHSERTSDFSLRQSHEYVAGTELCYRTNKPHGPPILLSGDYLFDWTEIDKNWSALVVQIGPIGNLADPE